MSQRKARQAARHRSHLSKTLTEIEGDDWGAPTYGSHLVTEVHRLRHKPVGEFTGEDLSIVIGQQLSLETLMPLALNALEANTMAEGDSYYPGDLLRYVVLVDDSFWRHHPELYDRVRGVVVAAGSRFASQHSDLATRLEAIIEST